MIPEIAEALGSAPSLKASPVRCPPESGIAMLAAYLAGDAVLIAPVSIPNPC